MSTSNYKNHPGFLAFQGSNGKKSTDTTQADESKKDKVEDSNKPLSKRLVFIRSKSNVDK